MTVDTTTGTVVALREHVPNGVELLEQAKAMLAQASSVREVKEIRDQAQAVAAYVKQAKLGLEAQNYAAEVKLRAERRAGELLDPKMGRPEKVSHDGTLSDLGISRNQSSRWQRIASLPDEAFEAYIVAAMERDGEITSAGALKLAKQTREPASPADFPPLPEGAFRTVVADPPWMYDNKATRGAAQDHYDTLTMAQLCGDMPLPDGTNLAKEVQSRLANEAHLYLWTTAGHLPDAFDVLEAWGFDYKTYLVWTKPQMGMGNYFRISTELVLFGVKGGMRTLDRGVMNYFDAPRRKHSAKPLVFQDLVVKASPGPFLEMFARHDDGALDGQCLCSRCRLGWETWGNQS